MDFKHYRRNGNWPVVFFVKFAPLLKISAILAIFSLSGNAPDSKERFIEGVSSLEQGPAAALRILAGYRKCFLVT